MKMGRKTIQKLLATKRAADFMIAMDKEIVDNENKIIKMDSMPIPFAK